MKQFQIAYKDAASLRGELEKINRWRAVHPAFKVLFRVYSTEMDPARIKPILDILAKAMPDALILGCTSNANLQHGGLAPEAIAISCTVFEYASTHVEVLQFPFTEANAADVVRQLRAYCQQNPWVSAVEMHATMLGMSVKDFCEEMSSLPQGIQVFGGGAYSPDMNDPVTYVFSKGNGFTDHGIIFLLLGGEDFHAHSIYISGWKPLTRQFRVTKSAGATLYELDGHPAFDVYSHFFNLEKNDYFLSNTLEFPLYMDYKGLEVLRCPLGLNDDGSFMMATEVPTGSLVRISFGDPETILRSIRTDGQTIADFQPDVIQVFSCTARKGFWGDENISGETGLFSDVAPTSGLYVSGEFMRIGGDVRNFNLTLVLAAMREGEPKCDEIVDLRDSKLDSIENEERLPLIRRFISFIQATTGELEAANSQLESLIGQLEESNKKLAALSITDGLTSLYNRTEIERGIVDALETRLGGSLSLLMLDLDNFKKVNDTYGHKEGDKVIIALSDTLRDVLAEVAGAYIGRWGGEEFMVLLQGMDIDEAMAYAEKIRVAFAAVSYEKALPQTVSIGVSQADPGETADSLCTRVDKALYTAKANGKNQVVRL